MTELPGNEFYALEQERAVKGYNRNHPPSTFMWEDHEKHVWERKRESDPSYLGWHSDVCWCFLFSDSTATTPHPFK